MNQNIVIVTDLGLLRAYRMVQESTDRQPRLELVEELKPERAHIKLTEQVTDDAGRFPKGTGASHVVGALSVGERHNMELEQTRRLLKLIADKINSLLSGGDVQSCWLAAGAPIHLRLLNELTPSVRAKVSKLIPRDLTKDHPTQLLGRFRAVAAQGETAEAVAHQSR